MSLVENSNSKLWAACNFLFHPLEQDTDTKKIISIVTSVALSILTGGVFALAFASFHIGENLARYMESKKIHQQNNDSSNIQQIAHVRPSNNSNVQPSNNSNVRPSNNSPIQASTPAPAPKKTLLHVVSHREETPLDVQVPKGIENGGNTCFINVVLQWGINQWQNIPMLQPLIQQYQNPNKPTVDVSVSCQLCSSLGFTVGQQGDMTAALTTLTQNAPCFRKIMTDPDGGEAPLPPQSYLMLTGLHHKVTRDENGNSIVKEINTNDLQQAISNSLRLPSNRQKKSVFENHPTNIPIIIPSPVQTSLAQYYADRPMTLSLSGEHFSNNKAAQYQCNFIAVYTGDERSGHYYCFRKVGNQWYLLNDGNQPQAVTQKYVEEHLKRPHVHVAGMNYKLHAVEQ